MSTLYLKMSGLLPNSSFSFIFLYFIKVIYITVFNYLGQLNLMPIHRPFFVFCNKHRIFETDHGKKYLTIFKFLLFVFCYWHSNGHFGGIRITDLRTSYHYWFTPQNSDICGKQIDSFAKFIWVCLRTKAKFFKFVQLWSWQAVQTSEFSVRLPLLCKYLLQTTVIIRLLRRNNHQPLC